MSGAANVITVRFVYDFDSDGTPDRMEVLQNVPMFFGNSFLYQSRITEYYFDQIYGDERGRIPVWVGDQHNAFHAPFPESVKDGKLTVEFWGGSSGAPLVPVQISQETSPLMNRASWVAPPYTWLSAADDCSSEVMTFSTEIFLDSDQKLLPFLP